MCGAGKKGTSGAAGCTPLVGLAVKGTAWTQPLASQTQRKHNAGEIMMLELVETLSKSKKGRIIQGKKRRKKKKKKLWTAADAGAARK